MKNIKYLILSFCLMNVGCENSPEAEKGELTNVENVLLINKENSPYMINKDLKVPVDTEFRLTAGAEVVVDTGVLIIVYGKMHIEGSEDEPVHIRPKVPGIGWDQIKVYGEPYKLTIKNAIIEDGRIMSSAKKVHYQNVKFYNSQKLAWNDALSRFWSPEEFLVEDCEFNGNNTGEGLLIHDPIEPVVRNCVFNRVPDGVEYLSAVGGIIHDNVFNNGGDDAIDLNNCDNTIIERNIINNYSDNGMELGSDGFGDCNGLIVRRNIMSKCRVGIRLKDDSQGTFINNSFYACNRGIESLIDPEGKKGSDVKVINSVFYKNKEDDWRKDKQSKMEILYSISDSRDLNKKGSNNIKADPLLVNPDALNFDLFPGSPCINAGDPNSEKDPDGSVADIGAVVYKK